MNEFEKAQSAKILACYGDIEKGRKGEIIGSEKNWGGKKYVKTNNGWIPKKDVHISSNKNHMESHKNVVDTKEDSGEKVSLQELQGVLNTMNQYNRQSGYMAFDNGGKFRFFDSMPSFGGAYVTKEDVEGYVRDYGKSDNDILNHTEAISSLVEFAKKIGYDPEKQSLDTLMEKWNEENEKIYNFLKENKDKVKEVVGGGAESHPIIMYKTKLNSINELTVEIEKTFNNDFSIVAYDEEGGVFVEKFEPSLEEAKLTAKKMHDNIVKKY